MLDKIIVFDIWGDYGYFRNGDTDTSTLTYPFPSRTTIIGLIGALIGLPKESYYDNLEDNEYTTEYPYFNLFNKENSKIGLRLLNPIEKMNINLNYINTQGGKLLPSEISKNPRVQVTAEFIKNPAYRIYASFNDEYLMKSLQYNLNQHKAVYTPCLGISECIANFKGVYDEMLPLKECYGENVHIDSVILSENGLNTNNIVLESGKRCLLLSNSPGFINNDKIITEYLDYNYEISGKPLLLKKINYYDVGGENIVLF